ncbi:MAG: hypothetical protein EBR82_39730 [Caulobacteraceae bacterium]|nr:hypothetical protein [Caulobacteraceae bacterium]
MRRTNQAADIPRLVDQLEQYGAFFWQTSGGAWILDYGQGLPGWLIDAFLMADERALSAFLRSRMKV